MISLDGTPLLTTKETAQILGVHPGTVKNWRADGTCPIDGVKIGNALFFREDDVKQLAKERAS